jgi:putative oxidoreductase
MLNTLLDARARLLALADKLSFVAPALIRLTLGVVFIQTGWVKLHTLPNVTGFFTELHIPLPALNARVVACTEFFGGILLLAGLGARLVSLPMAFSMLVAILTAKRENIDGIASLLGFEESAYLVMFLVIALIGPGALSLDALIARRAGLRSPSAPRA